VVTLRQTTPQSQDAHPQLLMTPNYMALVRHARRKESYVGNDSLDVLLCRR